jgi:hypothetical protein
MTDDRGVWGLRKMVNKDKLQKLKAFILCFFIASIICLILFYFNNMMGNVWKSYNAGSSSFMEVTKWIIHHPGKFSIKIILFGFIGAYYLYTVRKKK